MNTDDIKNNGLQIGREIGAMLELLDVPLGFKQCLATIMVDLSPDSLEKMYNALREAVEDQVVLESNTEYQQQSAQIDNDTVAELEAIINE